MLLFEFVSHFLFKVQVQLMIYSQNNVCLVVEKADICISRVTILGHIPFFLKIIFT